MELWRFIKRIFTLGGTASLANILEYISNSFERLSESLAGVSSETETEVLMVSRHLRELSGQYKTNARLANNITAKLDSQQSFNRLNLQELTSDINEEIQKTLGVLTESQIGLTTVQTKLNKVGHWQRRVEDFRDTTHMISTLMRMEAAKIEQEGFDDLVSSIRTLSKNVGLHVDKIADQISTANSLIQNGKEEADYGFQDIVERIRGNKLPLREIFANLEAVGKSFHSCCVQVEANSAMVNPEIRSMIEALQYHDISRQQLEHVSELFLREKEAEFDQEKNKGSWYETFISLQTLQLQGIAEENNNMYFEVVGNLNKAVDLAVVQAEEAQKANRIQSTAKKDIHKLHQELQKLLMIMELGKEKLLVLQGTAVQVKQQLELLFEEVGQVNKIRKDIQMLSLNSLLKTIRVGGNSGPLNILSTAIRDVSFDLEEIFTQEKILIEETTVVLENFYNAITNELESQLNSIDHIRILSEEKIEHLQKDSSEIMETMTEITTQTMGLKENTQELLGKLDFHKIMKNKIDEVTLENNHLAEELIEAGISRPLAPRILGEKLTEIRGSYTTDQERLILDELIARLPALHFLVEEKKAAEEAERLAAAEETKYTDEIFHPSGVKDITEDLLPIVGNTEEGLEDDIVLF